MKHTVHVLILQLLLTAGAIAAEPLVRYELKGYPKGELGCVETAILAGETFSKATGAKVERAYCEREHRHSYDLRITYQPVALDLVSTENRSFYAGTYKTIAECESEKASQLNLFEDRTKLSPFLAYCYFDESGISSSIGLRIDAIGKPAETPITFHERLYKTPVAPATIEAELASTLKAFGATPAIVKVVPAREVLGWTRVVLKYYAPKPLTLQLRREQFLFGSKPECESQAQALKGMLASKNLAASSVFCGWDGLRAQASLSFIAPSETPWFRVELAGERFNSLNACQAQKDRIVELFKSKLKQPVFGGICAHERDITGSLRPKYRAEMLLPCSAFGAAECRRPTFP